MANLILKTSFEDVTKVDRNTLSLPVPHRFNPGYPDPGEALSMFFIEEGFAYSGNKCLGLRLENGGQSDYRAEFNITGMEYLVGEEYYAQWMMYFPPDFSLDSPTNRWSTPVQIHTDNNPPTYAPKTHLFLNEPNPEEFWISVGGRDENAAFWDPLPHKRFSPKGRWIPVAVHFKRGDSIKFWLDKALQFETHEIPPIVASEWSFAPVKIYCESDDPTTHVIYIDDLEIWDGLPPPTPTSPLGLVPWLAGFYYMLKGRG